MKTKEKKAFTLIELLAVIVILAIILIIAIPSIGKIINKSRENSIESDIKMMVNSARTYVNKTGEYVPSNGQIEIIPLKTLITKNYISKIIYPDNSKKECDGAVIIRNTNGKYSYEGYLNCGAYLSDNINELYNQLDKTVENKTIEALKENTSLLPNDNSSVQLNISDDLSLNITDPMDPDNNVVSGTVTVNNGTSIIEEEPVGGENINTGIKTNISNKEYQIISNIIVQDENDNNIYINGEVVGGTNDNEEEEEPKVLGIINVGGQHSTYVINNKLYMFGKNQYGQLGDNTKTDKPTPFELTIPGETIKQATGSLYHSALVTESGKLYTFGYNNNGQLGDGTKIDKITPTLITIAGETIKYVELGKYDDSAVITESGKLYTFGYNNYGQLGDGTTGTKTIPTLITIPGETIKTVALGKSHSAVVTESGKLYTFGFNNHGQLGDGTEVDKKTPILITIPGETIKDVACGNMHTVVITESGKLYTFGYNNYGNLGNGTIIEQWSPIQITIPSETIKQVAAGGSHTAVITESGKLYVWGNNYYGQVGIGSTGDYKTTPQLITLPDETITSISAGDSFTIATTASGKVYAWGLNANGQLGDKTTINKTTPTLITIP